MVVKAYDSAVGATVNTGDSDPLRAVAPANVVFVGVVLEDAVGRFTSPSPPQELTASMKATHAAAAQARLGMTRSLFPPLDALRSPCHRRIGGDVPPSDPATANLRDPAASQRPGVISRGGGRRSHGARLRGSTRGSAGRGWRRTGAYRRE